MGDAPSLPSRSTTATPASEPDPTEGGSYENGVLVHRTLEDGPTGVPKE